MRTGLKDRRIRLERATFTRNAFGEDEETWGELATVYAEKREGRSREIWRAGEIAAERRVEFRIWWSQIVSDLSPLDRLVFEGRTYQILGVAEDEAAGRRRELIIGAVVRAE